MESIKPPFNAELIKILDDFRADFFKNDLTKLETSYQCVSNLSDSTKAFKSDDYTESSYLEYMQTQHAYNSLDETGFPQDVYGIDLLNNQIFLKDSNIKSLVRDVNFKLAAFFCTQFCAVNMFYPKNGYMGWHNNQNCPGWNVILSYTEPPHQGFFRFVDPKTKKIKTLYDDQNMLKGWTVKVGYYGGHDEIDKHYWHCARTYNNRRITFGYVIPQQNKNLWDQMVEDLT